MLDDIIVNLVCKLAVELELFAEYNQRKQYEDCRRAEADKSDCSLCGAVDFLRCRGYLLVVVDKPKRIIVWIVYAIF